MTTKLSTKKSTRLTGPEWKARRAAAEASAEYGEAEKDLIKGKTTEVVVNEALGELFLGNYTNAADLLRALRNRETANRLTFHPTE